MESRAERDARTETSEVYKFIYESEQQNDKLMSEQCGLEENTRTKVSGFYMLK